MVGIGTERAFEIFTAKMASWWPLATHHIAKVPAQTAVVEPRAGGRWFERAEDGSECEWGRVLVWDPPERLVLDWQLNAAWEYDPNFHTDLEVRFRAQTEGSTLVELEHRNLEAYGAQAEDMRQLLGGAGAWELILGLFAGTAK